MKKNYILSVMALLCSSLLFAQSYLPVQHAGIMLDDLVAPGVSSVCLDEQNPPVLTYDTTVNNTTLPDIGFFVESPLGITVLDEGTLNLSSNSTIGWLQTGDEICVSAIAFDADALNATLLALGNNNAFCLGLGIEPNSCDNIAAFVAAGGSITNLSEALDFAANLDVPAPTSTEAVRDILNIVNSITDGLLNFSMSNGGYGKDYCLTIDTVCNPVNHCSTSLSDISNPLGVTSICQDEANPPTLVVDASENDSTLPDYAYVVEANGMLFPVEDSIQLFSSDLNFVEAGQQICVTGVSYDLANLNFVATQVSALHTPGNPATSGCVNIGVAEASCDVLYQFFLVDSMTLTTFADALFLLSNLDVPPANSIENLSVGLNIVNNLTSVFPTPACFALTNGGLGNSYCIDVTGPCNPIAQCDSLGTLMAPSAQATVCRDGSDAPAFVLDSTANTSALPDFSYLVTTSTKLVTTLDADGSSIDLSPGATIGYLNPGDNFCVTGVAYDIDNINFIATQVATIHTPGNAMTSGCVNIGIAEASCDAIYDFFITQGGSLVTLDDAIDFTTNLDVPPPNSLGNIIIAFNTINNLTQAFGANAICFAMTNEGTGADFCYEIADCDPSINACNNNNLAPLTCPGTGTLAVDGSDAPTITATNPNTVDLPNYAVVIESPNGLEILEDGASLDLDPNGFCTNVGEEICVSGVSFNLDNINFVIGAVASVHTPGATSGTGCINLGIAPSSCDNIYALAAGEDGVYDPLVDTIPAITSFASALDFTSQLDVYPATSIDNLILGLNVITDLTSAFGPNAICFGLSNNGVGNDCCYTVVDVADCPAMLTRSGNEPAGVVSADDVISSTATVSAAASGGDVDYNAGAVAGEYIELLSGFEAAGDVNFTAENIECDSSDN